MRRVAGRARAILALVHAVLPAASWSATKAAAKRWRRLPDGFEAAGRACCGGHSQIAAQPKFTGAVALVCRTTDNGEPLQADTIGAQSEPDGEVGFRVAQTS